MNLFKDFLAPDVDQTSQNILIDYFLNNPLKVDKNKWLLSAGEMCNYIYFVKGGLLRTYYFAESEKGGFQEITAWFITEGSFFTQIDSFFNQKPSSYYIEAIEDSDLYRLSYEQLTQLYELYPGINKINRIMYEQYLCLYERRIKIFQLQNASAKYRHFVKQFPSVVNRARLGDIASYLGMSQEHLSRIRGKHK